jgi:hypothetical protein
MQRSSTSVSRVFNKFYLLNQFARPQFVFMIISQLQIFLASNPIIRGKFCNGKFMQPGKWNGKY